MITEKQQELIHASFDKPLSGFQRRKLERLLADSAEARELYSKLNAMQDSLAAVAPIEPPQSLRATIMSEISQLQSQRQNANQALHVTDKVSFSERIAEFVTQLKPTHTVAFAGGLVAGLAIFAVYLSDPNVSDIFDNNSSSGSMVTDPSGGAQFEQRFEKISSESITLSEISGSVSVSESTGKLRLEVNVENIAHGAKVKISARFDSETLSFSELSVAENDAKNDSAVQPQVSPAHTELVVAAPGEYCFIYEKSGESKASLEKASLEIVLENDGGTQRIHITGGE